MTAPTHAAFSLVFAGGVLALSGVSLSQHGFACGTAVLGSLLPDVDSRGSALGRLLPWLSARLERWPHRTLTHSLLAVAALALCLLPLARLSPLGYLAFLLGLLSHLMLDCFTKSGVALGWPCLAPCVLPRRERYRLETGSLTERALLAALVVFLVLVVPAAPQGGLWPVMRYLLATRASAYEDYLETPAQALLEFRGRWRDSHQEILARAPILTADGRTFTVALDGRPVVCGGDGEIVLQRARVVSTGRPVRQDTLALHGVPWDTLLARLPEGAWGSGRLQADRPLETPADSSLAVAIRADNASLHLRFAPRPWLAAWNPVPRHDPAQSQRLRQRLVDGEAALAALSRQRPRLPWQRLALAETEQAALADSLVHETAPLRFTGVLDLTFPEP